MDKTPEKLYLLEFLIDCVKIQKTPSLLSQLNQECNWFKGQTCVSFQFMSFPILQVCEADFSTSCGTSDECAEFKSGKSCLFSVSDDHVLNCPCNDGMALDVSVHRKLPPGILPEKLLIGQTKIPIKDKFVQILDSVQKNPEEVPVSVAIKDTFVLVNSNNKAVGLVNVFVRLSCFGKLIVTQFQMAEANKAFLFKGGGENSAMYQCTEINSHQLRAQKKFRQVSPCKPPEPTCCNPYVSCGHCGNFGGSNSRFPCGTCEPCNPCSTFSPCLPCGPCNSFTPCGPRPCGACDPCRGCSPCGPCSPCKMNEYCPAMVPACDCKREADFDHNDCSCNQENPPPCPCYEEQKTEEKNDPCAEFRTKSYLGPEIKIPPKKKDYEEIGAELNGHAITIRVPKSRKHGAKTALSSGNISNSSRIKKIQA